MNWRRDMIQYLKINLIWISLSLIDFMFLIFWKSLNEIEHEKVFHLSKCFVNSNILNTFLKEMTAWHTKVRTNTLFHLAQITWHTILMALCGDKVKKTINFYHFLSEELKYRKVKNHKIK